jgi:hypothetical protein
MRRLILFLLLLPGSNAFAAKPGPYGFWPGYYGSGTINERLGVWLEVQPRMYDFQGDLEQLLTRAAITYKLTPDAQVAQGYGYIRSEPYIAGTEDKRITEEHRVYQQLVLRQRWSRLFLQHRYRLEERFLPDNNFRLRFRYFIGGNLCLNKKELVPGTAYLSLYNEVFLHTDKPVFDRNRLYGGLGYTISKSLRVEAGNMWQMQEATTRPQLQLMLWHNFNL